MVPGTEFAGDPALRGNRGDAASTRIEARAAAATGLFAPRGLEIRPDRLLRMMGYGEDRPARPMVRRTAEAMAELAASAMTPSVHYCGVSIAACGDDRLVLSGGTTFHSPAFRKHLSGCIEAVVFVLTLGSRLDSTERNLVTADKLLEAVFLENAGWLGVEETTRLFAAQLAAASRRRGFALSRRLAPGYSFRLNGRKVGWPLEDQKALFALFADVALPVALLDSCAMTPKMSRTGLFGLRPAPSSNASR